MIEPCMCRGVVSTWSNYPFIRQGVMHSPLGCLRRGLSKEEIKRMYFLLSGFHLPSDDWKYMFDTLMGWLKLHPEKAKEFGTELVLVPVPYAESPVPNKEITSPRKRKTQVVPVQPPASPTQISGSPKPPWIKD